MKKKNVTIPTVTVPGPATVTKVKRQKKPKGSRKPGKSKQSSRKRPRPRARTRPQVMTGAPPVGSTPPRMQETPARARPARAKRLRDVPRPDEMQAEQTTEPAAAAPSPEPAAAETVPPAATPVPVPAPVPVDARMVQGAQCTWIGRMDQAIDHPETSVPVCPHCQGNLITAQDEETIQLGFEAYELGAYQSVNPAPRPHPGYRGLMAWMREQGKCWLTVEAAAGDYYQETGKLVSPGR